MLLCVCYAVYAMLCMLCCVCLSLVWQYVYVRCSMCWWSRNLVFRIGKCLEVEVEGDMCFYDWHWPVWNDGLLAMTTGLYSSRRLWVSGPPGYDTGSDHWLSAMTGWLWPAGNDKQWPPDSRGSSRKQSGRHWSLNWATETGKLKSGKVGYGKTYRTYRYGKWKRRKWAYQYYRECQRGLLGLGIWVIQVGVGRFYREESANMAYRDWEIL